MKTKPLPSCDELNRVFEYRDGELYWRVNSTRNKKRIGTIAGSSLPTGYKRVNYNGREMYQHRIIFKMVNGYDPDEVDHANVVNSMNTVDNLRNATSSQNKSNRKGFAKSGYKGVLQRNGKFCAFITYCGAQTYLGSYSTAEDAHEAFCIMANILYGEYANTGHRDD